MVRLQFLSPLFVMICCTQATSVSSQTFPQPENDLVDLGRALFFDTNLSEPPGQACATCHDPERAFSESREGGTGGALSRGADGIALADRNTPSLTYAATIPPFRIDQGDFSGGFFLDGRAATLQAQVQGPLFNPLEMNLPDSATLRARILANDAYKNILPALFGVQVLEDDTRLLEAVSVAIEAFERTEEFSRFNSKYDRYLAGEYTMTRPEAIGRELFFSDLVNCVQCHVNEPRRISPRETFTNYRYHNIGVPPNRLARSANGLGLTYRDSGLGGNPLAGATGQEGKFRVPGLRNVAVTAPYMHNGVFETLEAAVAFYAQYTVTNRPSQINPDTGRYWQAAEIPATIERKILSAGQPIDQARVNHLVAFPKTLTDRRYEHLIQ